MFAIARHLWKWSAWIATASAVAVFCLDTARAQERSFSEIANAVVRLEVQVKPGARTAQTLGPQRIGSGVIIDDKGLILTIGYLIIEAGSVRVATRTGRYTPADVVAYDHRSGFGLVRARTELGIEPLELGSPETLEQGAPLMILSVGSGSVTPVRVASRRVFAGSWEYLLENAIYTMPPHREFGGAALINLQGHVMGIGSLFVSDALAEGSQSPGNMFVPVDILKPILTSLVETGRSGLAPRPWLGVYASVAEGRVYVERVAKDGPGAEAGLKSGDIIVGVEGRRVGSLEDYLRKIWAHGEAGAEVNLDILPFASESLSIKKTVIRSRDRHRWLRMDRE